MTEQLELEITELGAQGDGTAKLQDGTAVFVPGTLPGDKVTARVTEKRRNGWTATLIEVQTPSKDRAEAPCRHFGKCGGCQLQFMKPDIYRGWVKARVEAALAHHGFPAGLVKEPFISPAATRRRITLKALKLPARLVLGFAEKKSHTLVDLQECPVTSDNITSLFPSIHKLLNRILKVRTTASVQITEAANGLDIVIEATMELSLEDRETLVEFADRHDIAALHWQDRGFLDPVAIRREPVMDFAGVKVPLPPAAFTQATKCGEEALVGEVMSALGAARRVADLFCGIGTFTFPAARQAQVLAVEGAKSPLDALQRGANFATGIKQVVPRHRDLFRRPMMAKELAGFDAVIFDPPRAGAKDQANELAKSEAPVVVGVSCNPNTFSRDARILVDGGYELVSVLPVDQFLWSAHVELVGVFTKQSG